MPPAQARGWRFGTPPMRSLLADYGVPFMVIVWSGLGYAVAKPAPGGIPRRLQMPQVWEVKSTWSVAGVRFPALLSPHPSCHQFTS